MRNLCKTYRIELFCLVNLAITFTTVLILKLPFIIQLFPGLLAVLIIYREQGKAKARKLFRKWFLTDLRSITYYIIAFLIPLTATLLIFFLWEQPSSTDLDSTTFPVIETIGVLLVTVIGSIAEEIGWRGFLLPEFFKKYSPAISAIVVGLIWGIWHFKTEAGIWVFLVYIIGTVEDSIVMTWLYLKTGQTLITSIIYHTSINIVFIACFGTGKDLPQMSYFGLLALLMLVPSLLAIYKLSKARI